MAFVAGFEVDGGGLGAAFLFRRGGFPVGPFVLGYNLAPLAEKELRSGLMLYDGSLMPLVTRPISLFFILLTLVLALWPLVQARIKARQATRSGGHQAARPGRG